MLQQLARRRLPVGTLQRYASTNLAASAIASRNLTSILIANRGEIALRVTRTAKDLGLRTTTIFTIPDAKSLHAESGSTSVNIGESSAYLDVERVIRAAKDSGCDAVHPGYGFLSENSHFAKRCVEEGLIFIGPPHKAIEAMGSKSESKKIMIAASVPCIAGSPSVPFQTLDALSSEAESIGYPVLIKAVMGGGGKGMRIAMTPEEFPAALESAKSESRSSFGNDEVLVEKYISRPRHVEVQVFADSHGNVVALGERDCSVQRRHQKVIEESPAPGMAIEARRDLWKKACDAAKAVGYEGAGTVEFILDADTGNTYFMEMNTRLQVEHPVTEMVTGLDLVEWQIRVARGEELPIKNQDEIERRLTGHAFEARIYAEWPERGFIPDSGQLRHLKTPSLASGIRVDAGFREGDTVSAHYDPMIAKLIVHSPDSRREALKKLSRALEEYEIVGMHTNIEFLKRVARNSVFASSGELVDGSNVVVETGFIVQQKSELFEELLTPPEVVAQAALGIALSETLALESGSNAGWGISEVGAERKICLSQAVQGDGSPTPPQSGSESRVEVSLRRHHSADGVAKYDISLSTGESYNSVSVAYSPLTRKLVSFFPHARYASSFVTPDATPGSPKEVTIFHHGTSYAFSIPAPAWLEKLLEAETGGANAKNSVLAPMPCKVLRVMVEAGSSVIQGQDLVVIESMKMETVIRSPSAGVVKRVVHGEGEMCKAGTPLVEFEGDGVVETERS